MHSGPEEPGPPADSPKPEQEAEAWNGLPLQLEWKTDDGGSGTASDEETADRPIARLLPPAAPPDRLGRGSGLSRWLLFTGSLAAALAAAAVALALLQGTRPVAWRGCLFALNCAIIILMSSSLVRGVPARLVCHRVFSIAGLSVAALVVQHAFLRSAIRFIYGDPPHELLTEFFVFGLMGLAGCVVFVQSLQERSWACRTAAVSFVVFLALTALQPFAGYGPLAEARIFQVGLPKLCVVGLAAAVLFAAGFALWLGRTGSVGQATLQTAARRRGRAMLTCGWVALLIAATAFVAYELWAEYGPARASALLWKVAALSEVTALLPLVLVGTAVAWRKRARLQTDVCEATHFAWMLVALGGLACLTLWILTHLRAGGLELALVSAGILAVMLVAWLGATHGDWVSRWALIPTAALTIAVLCTLNELLALAGNGAPPHATPWVVAVAYLWCPVVVGLAFATAGLAVRRLRARSERPALALQADTSLLCTTGWAVSGLLLAVLFTLAAGNPDLTGSLRAALGQAQALARGALTIAGGALFTQWALRALSPVRALFAGTFGTAALTALLLGIFAVHLMAASRVRWSFYVLVALWAVPLALGVMCGLVWASHLFGPLQEPMLTTPAGRLVGSHFAARLVLLAVLVALVVRFGEATRSVLQLCGRPARRPMQDGARQPPWRQNSHLVFLVHFGILVSLVGLTLAFLLYLSPSMEAALLELRKLANAWLAMGAGFTSQVGRLAGRWSGYAAAAALVAFLFVAIHEEARRGRVALYPLVGTAWLLLLVPCAFSWTAQLRSMPKPAPPGKITVLAAAGLLLVVLFLAAAVMWIRWWRLAAAQAGETRERPEADDATVAARSLGSIGLILWLAACAVVLHTALISNPLYARHAERAADAVAWLAYRTAFWIEYMRCRLEVRRSVGSISAALGGVSGALLLLHLVSRHRVAWARSALCALWAAAVLAGAGAVGYTLSQMPFGTWGAEHVVLALLLIVLLVRTLVAVANARSWLVRRSA